MKIKEGFLLKNIAGMNVVVSTDVDSAFDGMITLNDSAMLLWNDLCDGATAEELAALLCREYEVEPATAQADVEAFLQKLSDANILE